MSRLGKLPIAIPKGTQAKAEGDFIIIKGPKGELREKINNLVNVELNEKEIKVTAKKPQDRNQKALWVLIRILINNMVIGVNNGYFKKLEINGIGFKASAGGKILTLNVGYSHPVKYDLPEGISAIVEDNIITISGIDKKLVGETAAQIRKIKKPEPYKGKGIKYLDEIVKIKVGKTAASKSE